ncbi:hypothetical protein HerbRD11066_16460 [Herbidospora sp. RD11066]
MQLLRDHHEIPHHPKIKIRTHGTSLNTPGRHTGGEGRGPLPYTTRRRPPDTHRPQQATGTNQAQATAVTHPAHHRGDPGDIPGDRHRRAQPPAHRSHPNPPQSHARRTGRTAMLGDHPRTGQPRDPLTTRAEPAPTSTTARQGTGPGGEPFTPPSQLDIMFIIKQAKPP